MLARQAKPEVKQEAVEEAKVDSLALARADSIAAFKRDDVAFSRGPGIQVVVPSPYPIEQVKEFISKRKTSSAYGTLAVLLNDSAKVDEALATQICDYIYLEYTDKLNQLKDLNSNKLRKLVKLKKQLQLQRELIEETSKPLSEAIDRLQSWREEWLAEKKRWN